MSRRAGRGFVAVSCAAAGLTVCCGPRVGSGSRPAAQQLAPSVLLISVDTMRADHLGCYGDREAATPNLDRWASEGVLFEKVTTPVPITLPAHATLLTGRLPFRHGVRDNGVYRLPEDVPTLAAQFGSAGYQTAAVVGAAVLDRQYGLARGFDSYDDQVAGAGQLAIAERKAAHVTDRALAIAQDLRRPYFLFAHYYDPHAVYDPPDGLAERFGGRPYDGEIAYVDEQLGRLRAGLEARGLLEGALVAITSDHGEGLGEHGEATHGVFLYQSTLHVPLVVVAPGRWPAGQRVAEPAALSDVAPTLLGLAGVPLPAGLDGRALLPTVTGRPPAPRFVPLESEFGYNSYGWAPLAGLTDGTLKWIDAPEPELYDLSHDPHEQHNLVSVRATEVRRLAQHWRGVVTEDRRSRPGVASDRENAERQERLASLGYVAGSEHTGAPRGQGLPDPKRAIGSLASINTARQMMGDGRFDQAARLLDSAIRQSPRNLSALILSGSCRLLQGQPRLALEPLRRATALAPANADGHFNLGLACLGSGDATCAEAAFRRTLALAPRQTAAAANLIDLLLQLDRAEEAADSWRQARDAGLSSPLLDYLEAQLADRRGDRESARAALLRALAGGLPPAVAVKAQARLRTLGG